MPKGKDPFSLKNMNGISHDDTRSCALSDMNCRRGQPDAPASQGDPCPLDGEDHGTTFFGRLTRFFHAILYFINRLFGRA